MSRTVLSALTGAVGVACAVGSRDALADGSEPRRPDAHFVVDPVTDGVLIASGIGFSTLLGTIRGTGEIRPTASTADPLRGRL